jgi:hypothetical protein
MPPERREIDWTDMHDGRKHAAVAMWTQQARRSDLMLEPHLARVDDGRWYGRILDLHVL